MEIEIKQLKEQLQKSEAKNNEDFLIMNKDIQELTKLVEAAKTFEKWLFDEYEPDLDLHTQSAVNDIQKMWKEVLGETTK